jgi:DNA-binding transcriptional regulator LsrR (DeoR family)
MITVTLLWAKSGRQPGRAHYVTITPPEGDGNLKNAKKVYRKVVEHGKVRGLYDEMKDVDILFSSIGALNADTEYKAVTQYLTKNLLDEIGASETEMRGVVGDINYSFFDKLGSTRPEWNPFPTLGVTELTAIARNRQRRVVITAGSYKMEALKAVLSGKMCNVLITDALAAEHLSGRV